MTKKNNPSVERDFITPPQLADRYGCDVSKVLTWIRSGELRAINVATKPLGRPRWRIMIEDLESFEAGRMASPPPKQTRRTFRKDDHVIKFYT